VNEAGIKLTTYFAERDRVRGAFLADALSEVYERHRILASVLLRGMMGFGDRPGVQSERSLTLSESLPAVSIAVDARERIERALPEVLELAEHGLVSLERARVVAGDELRLLTPDALPGAEAAASDDALKLTLYGGRGVRADGAAGYVAAIEILRAAGATGASALLGVDGTLHGERRRAHFFARNAGVPLMLLAIGSRASILAALPALSGLLEDPVATIERVTVCRSRGSALSAPAVVPERDDSGLPIWQKLIVHAEEQASYGGHPLHLQLIGRLRGGGAAGATVLRGVRGFYGEEGPFADRVVSIKRHAPLHTVLVDSPANVQRLWPVIEEVTVEAGLVTSELVPAFHREPARADPDRPHTWLARVWGEE